MSQWVKDNDVVNKVLFAPTSPRYGRMDFPNMLVWLGHEGERFPCLMRFPLNRKVRYVIIYFHGNSTDISGIAYFVRTMMIRLQVGVIAPEYPGYGISEGVACESSAKKCGRRTLEFVKNDLKVPLERIVIFGTSIGTGVASWLGKKVAEKDKKLGALILQSPFTSIKAIMKGISIFESQVANYFAQVGSTFVADRFKNIQCLRNVKFPLLILHGAEDNLIPVTHGKAIYNASKSDIKNIVIFPGVGHNNFDCVLVISKIREFLEKLTGHYRHGKKIVVETDTWAVRAKRKSPPGNVEQKAKARAKSGVKVTNVVSSAVGTIFGSAIGMAQSLRPEKKEPTMAILSSPAEPRVKNEDSLLADGIGTWKCHVCMHLNRQLLDRCQKCFSSARKQDAKSSALKSASQNALPLTSCTRCREAIIQSGDDREDYLQEGERKFVNSGLETMETNASTIYL